ncbi:SDR family oxidoreductase [Persicobacter psychrovividus]|uniref:Dioxygenase n=1 Tax=Persicobacter psychrovividus TaxID=387638 RepID=A0ABM7VLP7_9BACT|nr:dioxygenase [Persicobacter psychrovividus]
MNQLFNIDNKTAVISGGAGVLGLEIAGYLLKEGVKVFILDYNEILLTEAIGKLEAFGEVQGFVCNVLEEADLMKTKDAILEQVGQIDILINAAGGNRKGANISPDSNIFKMDRQDFKMVNDLNFLGTVYPTLVFGEAMAKNGKGSIINFSSMATVQSISRVMGYSAAKAAVDNFTKWMAQELASKFGDQIRVNAVAPGFFVTHQNRAILINEDGSLTERSELVMQKTPMNRFGKPEELCGAIHFLCAEASSFITGTIIPIDGGFSSFSGV